MEKNISETQIRDLLGELLKILEIRKSSDLSDEEKLNKITTIARRLTQGVEIVDID